MRFLTFILGIILLPTTAESLEPYYKYPGYSVDQLIVEAKKFDKDAIYRLGERKDPRAIPVLMAVLQQERPKVSSDASRREQLRWGSKYPRPATIMHAKCALARLGLPRYMDEILADLSDARYPVKLNALNSLGIVAEPATVKYIIPLLDDHYSPPRSSNAHDLGSSMPVSYWAATALNDILPRIGATLQYSPHYPPKPESWRHWWSQQNPKNYSLPRREK